jgi:hypothetical protein
MTFGQVRDAGRAEKTLDADLAMIGIEGTIRVEEGEDEGIMKTSSQSLEMAGDGAG